MRLRHSIIGGLTHPNVLALADRLAKLMPTPDRHAVFASDGFLSSRTVIEKHADIDPDMVCVGKALTAGYMPLSACIVKDRLYETFSDQGGQDCTFYHGNTYAGHPIGCAAALAALDIYAAEDTVQRAAEMAEKLNRWMLPMAEMECVRELRFLGMIGVVELKPEAGPLIPNIAAATPWRGYLIRVPARTEILGRRSLASDMRATVARISDPLTRIGFASYRGHEPFFCSTNLQCNATMQRMLKLRFIPGLAFTGLCLAVLACAHPCLAGDFAHPRPLAYRPQEMPEILVNPQGLAQQDLSIRGGSYSGTGISINGLNLKVPYSAHFNADLPVSQVLFSDPTARYGLPNASGPLVGNVAYTTALREQYAETSAGIGTKEHYAGSLSAFSRGVGGFLNGEKAKQVDYEANSYARYAGGVHAQQLFNDWQVDLIGAGQQKEFGAQGYYGIPGTVYAEQQTGDALLYLGAVKGELDDAYIRTGAAWREFNDEISGLTPFVHEVRSRYGSAMLEGRTMEIQHIALTLRGDVELEAVDGTTGPQDRTRGSVLILPEARFERVTFKAGVNSVFQTSECAAFLPLAGVDWFATDNTMFYAAYSEKVQQPDYQTLENNPLLQQQESGNAELGLRQFLSASLDWRAAAFHRRLENASDWIGGTIATDLGTLRIAGVDTVVRYYPSAHLTLQLYYQWVHKNNSRADGFYELDYPEHMLNLSASWKFLNDFALQFAQTTRLQTDNNARTSSDFGADASLGLHYFPRFAKNVRLSFRVDNLWGSNFQAMPGLDPRPLTVFSGITVAW